MCGNSLRRAALGAAVVFVLSSSWTCCSQAKVDSNSVTGKVDLIPGLDSTLIDTKADPCVDFAAYACGRFSSLHPIPSDQTSWGSFDMLYEYTQQDLHALLDKMAANDPKRSSNEQKVGDYYASCMDEDAINRKGLGQLQAEMDEIAELKSKSELANLLAQFQLQNAWAFFAAGEQQDLKDATKQIAFVDQAGLGLPERDYYFRTGDAAEKTRRQYVEHLTSIFKLLGESDATAAADAKKVMRLETALAKNSMDVTARRDPKNTYHMKSMKEVEALTPAITWAGLFDRLGTPRITELNVANPEFFQGLEQILASTDLDTIKSYLRWQLINATNQTALPKAFDDEQFKFYGHELEGRPEQRARWKRCAQATDDALGEALGEVYVNEHFPPSSKAYTLQMVQDIEAAMDHEVDALNWMSATTKVQAKEKLHKVANKIGYPDRWRDYSKLEIERGDAMKNAIAAVVFENHRQLAKIGKPVDRGEWGMSPPTINAYYNPSMNDINFPAGILQPPFYDMAATDAENYGHIGAVIGHELTHGFDDQGAKFDKNGNLADWWTADDEKKFNEMTGCEVGEYGTFTAIDDVKLNGKLTLGENTADNGGVRLAYLAFLVDAGRKQIDLKEKTGGYTPAQQFFISYAQNWCETLRPEYTRLLVQTNEHSPGRFRIDGVVQNMQEFSDAFGCKVGQPMRPANACHVW